MKNLLLTLLLTTTLFAASAQNVYRGRITDENGLALPGATVLVTDLDNVGAVTGVDGDFALFDLPEGKHTLKIAFIGYNEIEQEFDTQSNEPINVRMEPGVILGDEILILGDRLKGQAKALNQQKTNINVTNIVAADQIGRFPDANIGDAVKRIPGITMQGDQGEARNVIIRGLAPQLNSVMINGERIPSAEGDNRNIQLDLIPADMVQTIEVNKAVTPDMDADAIGGAVNLVTRSQPSGMRLSGTFASGYNSLSQKPIWTGGLIYGDRFANDKLGMVASLSYNNHRFGSDNIEAEWNNEVESELTGEDIDADPYVEEMDIRRYQVQRIRRSASVNLDYKINENHTIFLKSMYNWRDDWENRYRLSYVDIAPIFADGTDNIIGWESEARRQTKGGIGNDRVDYRRLEDQRVRTFGLSGEHFFGKAKLTWSGNYAKASEDRPNERYIRYESEDSFDINMDLTDTEFPFIDPINPESSAASFFVFDEMSEENQYTEEEDINSRIDLELPVSVIPGQQGKLKFGGRLRSKNKLVDNNFFEYAPADGSVDGETHPIFGGSWDAAEEEWTNQTMDNIDFSDQSDADYLADPKYQIGDFVTAEFLGDLDFGSSDLEEEDAPSEYLAGNYNADELVTGGYVMLTQDITSKFSTMVGVRVEHTSLDYTGNSVENEEDFVTEITNSDSYTNFLPGVHLKYDLNNNMVIRGAWTNTLARPNYFDLVPFVDNRIDDEELFLGNPNLDPTTSMNVDLSVENYFKTIGLVSASYFYKNIDDFIYTAASEDANTGFDVFQPQNGGTGTINGIEVAFQRQLDFLPGALKGLGIYLNYTYTNSTAEGVADEDGESREDLDLPGTADNLFNASLSFETAKLVLRVSLNYAGDYIDEVADDAFFDRYYDEQLFLDINGSYAFRPNWRLFFEANNLTNQPLRYFQGVSSRTMQSEFYGSRYNVGVKFDMFRN